MTVLCFIMMYLLYLFFSVTSNKLIVGDGSFVFIVSRTIKLSLEQLTEDAHHPRSDHVGSSSDSECSSRKRTEAIYRFFFLPEPLKM